MKFIKTGTEHFLEVIQYMKDMGFDFRDKQPNYVKKKYWPLKGGSSIQVRDDYYNVYCNEYDGVNVEKALNRAHTFNNDSSRQFGFLQLNEDELLVVIECLLKNPANVAQDVLDTEKSTQDDDARYKTIIDKFFTFVLKNDPIANEGVSFRTRGSFLEKEEGYKLDLYYRIHNSIEAFDWNIDQIGTGRIASDFGQVLKGKNNLVGHYQLTGLKDMLSDQDMRVKVERVIYDIYKNDAVPDEEAFEKACEIFGRKYDLISFLFFVKDKSKYLPVRSYFFEKGLKQLGIEYELDSMCSWNNYEGLIYIISDIQKQLEKHLPTNDEEITLLDAQSFLWIVQQDRFVNWNPDEKEKRDTEIIKRSYKEIRKNNRINKAKEIDNTLDKFDIKGKEREAIIKVRVNQGVFRERLLARYDRTCCLCGVNDEHLLIASHIKPWRDCSEDERLDVNNGFLLCPNHDRLFDYGLITFNEEGHIIISEKLSQKNQEYMLATNNTKKGIKLTEENKKYLEIHRNRYFEQ